MKLTQTIHRFRDRFHSLRWRRHSSGQQQGKVKEAVIIEAPTAQTIKVFGGLARWKAILAVVVGYHVALGWLFDIQVLKSPGLTFAPTHLSEALCAVLAGLALLRLVQSPDESIDRKARLTVRICGSIITLVTALSLLEDLFRVNVGVDSWFSAVAAYNHAAASGPHHMALMSTLSFGMIGVSLILVDRPEEFRSVEALTLISAAISLLAIASYLYDAGGFGGQMPLYGASVIFLLSTGILCARPAQGFMVKISSDSFGGIMARRLLPATLLIPLVLGFIQYRGLRAGIYATEPGLALFAVADVLLFLCVIWWGVNSLHGMDTRRRKAEHDLQETAAKLARSNADLEQFAYVASHDLKEPLRAISGSVQILQEQYSKALDGTADEVIKHTIDGANRMQTLIDDLLAYSRITTREAVLEPTDLGETLDEALVNLELSIRESKVVITHDALPTVIVDPTQLAQVFQNLISNAIKYRSQRTPRIHVGAEDRGREWVMSVRDNGIGIAPQYADRIFRIFQRLHTRKEYPGTGIGLAICKKIIERHGGRIWLESELDEGSTFYFTLLKS